MMKRRMKSKRRQKNRRGGEGEGWGNRMRRGRRRMGG